MDFARLLKSQCLTLIEKTPFPVCIFSQDLTLVYLNPPGARLLLNHGTGSPDNQPQGLIALYRSHTDTPFPFEAEMERIMTGGQAAVIADLEVRREEVSRFITLTALPLSESNGRPAGLVLLIEDRTSQQESTHQAERLSRRLRAGDSPPCGFTVGRGVLDMGLAAAG